MIYIKAPSCIQLGLSNVVAYRFIHGDIIAPLLAGLITSKVEVLSGDHASTYLSNQHHYLNRS